MTPLALLTTALHYLWCLVLVYGGLEWAAVYVNRMHVKGELWWVKVAYGVLCVVPAVVVYAGVRGLGLALRLNW